MQVEDFWVNSSGGTYSAVPTNDMLLPSEINITFMNLLWTYTYICSPSPLFRGFSSQYFAVPKSVIWICIVSVSKMFSGLRSLYQYFLWSDYLPNKKVTDSTYHTTLNILYFIIYLCPIVSRICMWLSMWLYLPKENIGFHNAIGNITSSHYVLQYNIYLGLSVHQAQTTNQYILTCCAN